MNVQAGGGGRRDEPTAPSTWNCHSSCFGVDAALSLICNDLWTPLHRSTRFLVSTEARMMVDRDAGRVAIGNR